MQPKESSPKYLVPAQAAARWILSRQSEGHRPSGSVEPLRDQLDLYSGNAGTILFFLELALATGEHSYQKIARNAVDYLANHLEQVTDSGLYTGLAGIAFSLDCIITTGDAVCCAAR